MMSEGVQNSSKPVIVKGFYLFSEPNNYCFCRAPQGQLPQCNLRNTVNVLRAVVKSQDFSPRCSRRDLKNFSKLTGNSPGWSPFIVNF